MTRNIINIYFSFLIYDKMDMVIKLKVSIKDNIELYRKIDEITSINTVSKKNYRDSKILNTNVRIFNENSSKILIYLHGGGWVSGSINTHTNICYKLAKELNVCVISLDYPLAPESKFPIALNEIDLVCQEIMNKYNNVSIMGDSAGANLAFAVAIKNRKLKFKEVILVYPATQTDYTSKTKYKSVLKNSGKTFLTKESLRDYLSLYLKNTKDYKNPYVNLLKNNWLFGFPKTTIITGTLDPLHDEGVALKEKLERFLVPVRHLDLEGAPHAFLTNNINHKYRDYTINFLKGSDSFE